MKSQGTKEISSFWIKEGLDHIKPNGGEFPEGFDVLKTLSELLSGQVIEIGCGYGRLSPAFDDYIGYDINPTAIEFAKTFFPDKEFRLYEGGDYTGESALLYTVLLHIPDVEDLIKKIKTKRVLVAEVMGRKWRRSGNPPVFNREADEYIELFNRPLITRVDVPYKWYRDTDITFLLFGEDSDGS